MSAISEFCVFMRNRAIRIFPVYFISLVVVCVLSFFSNKMFRDVPQYIFWYICYTQNFLIALVTKAWGGFSHTWSLAVEQQFYLIFGFLFILLPTRFWFRAMMLAFALSTLVVVLLFYVGLSPISMYSLPFTGFRVIAAGGVARIYAQKVLFGAEPKLTLSLSIICVAFISLLAVLPRNDEYWSDMLPVNTQFVTYVVSLFSCILLACLYNAQESKFVDMLDCRFLFTLGAVSYAFYVLQGPIGRVVSFLFSSAKADFGAMIFVEFVVSFSITLICSVVSFIVIERPARFLRVRL